VSAAHIRTALQAVALAAALAAPTHPASADPTRSRLLPPGSRPLSDGVHHSGQSFRDSLASITRALARQGIATNRLGPYRRRGTTVVRFLATTPTAPIAAIHLWTTAGRTYVFIVPPPAEPLDPPATTR
jgi:hypothetical protein